MSLGLSLIGVNLGKVPSAVQHILPTSQQVLLKPPADFVVPYLASSSSPVLVPLVVLLDGGCASGAHLLSEPRDGWMDYF